MVFSPELESALGVPGPSKVRQALSRAKKPSTFIQAVRRFQDDNRIKVASLPSAMKLLDLHGIKQKDFNETVLTDVTEKLLSRIRVLGQFAPTDPDAAAKLYAQLEKSFPVYKVPQFTPIVLETLKQVPAVPEEYLNSIVYDPALYAECDIVVRQQIWLSHTDMFLAAVAPIIQTYLKKKRDIETSLELTANHFFNLETTKSRRQWDEVQQLIKIVGKHEQLYLELTKYLKQLYGQTGNVHLCSLRAEIVMAGHDANVESIVRKDASHDFVWCLDSCMRDKHLDAQQTAKLRNLLDSLKSDDVDVIGNIAMVAADVHTVHFLMSIAVRKIRDATGSHFPREVPSVQVAMRIVALGSHAREIVSTNTVPSTMLDSIIFTKFLPLMEQFMMFDSIRLDLLKAEAIVGDDVSHEMSAASSYSIPIEESIIHGCLDMHIPEVILSFLKTNLVASYFFLHYALDMFPIGKRSHDPRGLIRCAPGLMHLRDKLASQGVWCHLLVQKMAGIAKTSSVNFLAIPAIKNSLLTGVLLGHVKDEPVVKFQILRLISHVGYVWTLPGCLEIMSKISPELLTDSFPEEDPQRYSNDYRTLMERLNPKPMEPLTLIHMPHMPTVGTSGLGSPPPVRQYPNAAPISTPRPSY